MILDKSVVCPVFIGRQNDLQSLDGLIGQLGDPHGQIALISGEAGIGKSRLVKEAKERAPTGTLILEGHCFQTESALPYAPLLDLFRNFFAAHTSQEIASLAESAASQLITLFPELAISFPHLTSIPSPDPKQEKRNLFQALLQTILHLAQKQTLILVIEDLHWSDSTSLEILLQLARRVSSLPILLLVTYRSDETTPELVYFLGELDRQRIGVEFALKHLNPPEVESMLQAILDLKAPVSREFLDTIFPLTEGNPFFIEEIFKSLIADGDIFYADGTWDRKEISQLHIPRTIQDAVQRRAQLLDEQTLHALTLAAVMGRRFDFRLLQEMLGVNERALTWLLKNLIRAQLVVEETADQFAFRHALTREAAYSTMLLRERQGLHRQVGEAIERLYADSINLFLADLSYHYYTGAVWEKALDYSRKAGDQARAFYAQHEAIIYYSRALLAAHQLKRPIEPELLSARGHAYETLGDFKLALEDFETALRIAREGQNGQAEWQTLIDLGFLWAGRDYQQTGDYFRRAEALARKLNESKLQAHSLNRLGNWYVNIGQTSQGLKDHYQALEIFAGEQDEQGTANTHDLLGMAAMQHSDLIGSFDEYQYAIQLFRKLGDKHGLVSALVGACNASYWDDTVFMPSQSRTENHHMAMEALELARQTGWAADQAFSEWGIALGLANKGLFGEALAHARESLRIATEIEHRQWIAAAHYTLGHTYALMLKSDLAIQNLKQSLALAEELGSAWWKGNVLTDLVIAYLLQDNIGQARSILGSAPSQADGVRTLVERRLLWARGSLLLADDQPEAALQIAEALLNSISNGNQMQPIPALLKLKGEALRQLGQWEPARQALQGAKAGAEQRDALPLLWQIHCLLGWLYKEHKNAEQAEQEFAAARQIIQNLGANIQDELLREEFISSACESLPKGKTVSKRQSEAEKFEGLTPREREVASHLAQGKSNREIAADLVLSERTVENHVGNILTKLGFDSRSQIAVWAVEKGLGKENHHG